MSGAAGGFFVENSRIQCPLLDVPQASGAAAGPEQASLWCDMK